VVVLAAVVVGASVVAPLVAAVAVVSGAAERVPEQEAVVTTRPEASIHIHEARRRAMVGVDVIVLSAG
jgi:hypothetical protein